MFIPLVQVSYSLCILFDIISILCSQSLPFDSAKVELKLPFPLKRLSKGVLYSSIRPLSTRIRTRSIREQSQTLLSSNSIDLADFQPNPPFN